MIQANDVLVIRWVSINPVITNDKLLLLGHVTAVLDTGTNITYIYSS